MAEMEEDAEEMAEMEEDAEEEYFERREVQSL